MADVPVQLVVAAFQDSTTAGKVLKDLKQAQRQGLIGIKDAAVITKDANGKVKISDTHDMGAGKGATIGAVTGAVLSLAAGPLGWMALGGGAIGSLVAKLRDGGFPQHRLQQIAEGLKPNSSALIAVIDHKWVGMVEAELAKYESDVMVEALRDDIAAELEAGRDTVYTVAVTGDAVMAAHADAPHDISKQEVVMQDSEKPAAA